MASAEYDILSVTLADAPSVIPELVRLFEISFNRRISPELLLWRYFQSPFGGPFMVIARDSGGALVGNYSACAMPLMVSGTRELSLLSMTTMTHPNHSGKGLFTRLASRLYSEAKGRAACVWGFPNANSHPGFVQKLGWRDVYELPTKVFPVDSMPAAQISAELIVVRRDDNFELEYSLVSDPSCITVAKDRTYLQWRYAKHPTNKYVCFAATSPGSKNVLGYAVMKQHENNLDLTEFHSDSTSTSSALVSAIVPFAQASNSHHINAWSLPWSPTHRHLEGIGAKSQGPVTYFGVRSFSEPADTRLHFCYNWNLQMGDSDVY